MGEIAFIVWRESVEALLVIAILYVWLRERADQGWGLRWLWAGVALGLTGAVGLALAMLGAVSVLDGEAGEWFQAAMLFTATGLIVHMVVWMRRHGRAMRQDLQRSAQAHMDRAGGWGVALLAALAIMREGSEAVIFLYGVAARPDIDTRGGFLLPALAGLGLALLSFWVLQAGRRWVSWRAFFRFSEAVLLLLAAALWISGVDRLISMDVLPTLVDPLWDSSTWLDDATPAGAAVAALTGYRAQPALISVLAYVAFWGCAALLVRRARVAEPRAVAA